MKTYYNSLKQPVEIAKVTLTNYEEVSEWTSTHNLRISFLKNLDDSGQPTSLSIVPSLVNASDLADPLLPKGTVTISQGQVMYIVRIKADNTFYLYTRQEYKELDWYLEHPLMQYFTYKHLPKDKQATSKQFADLALEMDRLLPNNPEKSAGLRKLLEAKDCAVRATFFK